MESCQLRVALALVVFTAGSVCTAAPPAGRDSDRQRPSVPSPEPRLAQNVVTPSMQPEPLVPPQAILEQSSQYYVTGQPVSTACPRCGVYCCNGNCGPELTWDLAAPIPWDVFAQGEYVGPNRLPHIPEYRLRTDDVLEFVFRLTAEATPDKYRLQPGDQLSVVLRNEISETPENRVYSRDWVLVEPDGYISLPFGQVRAAGMTFQQLRDALEKLLAELQEERVLDPRVMVTPASPRVSENGRPSINTRLEEFRNTVDARYAVTGGQTTRARITPEGTVQLPAIGSVPATGLTLQELKQEIEARYGQVVYGVEVTPVLFERAPRYIFVLGEVRNPGRYTLEGPTTVMQAISLAGSWNVGARLKEIVVFRRDDDWRLMATKLNVYGALFGKRPCPADEIWLRDSDIVLVPQSPILATDNMIELVFTRGIYSVLPFDTSFSWSSFVLRGTRFQ